jgi:ketosteroid isomerase-like protein
MRSSAAILLLLSLLVIGCEQRSDPAAVRQILDQKAGHFTEAFNRHDADGLMADFWNSPNAVAYYPGGNHIGYDAVRQSWEGFFQNVTVKQFTITERYTEVDNKTAYQWGVYDIIIEPRGGTEMSMPGRFTQMWRHIDGKWVVVVEHVSHPLPPPPGS